jgi:hypothetical protein
VLLSSYSGSSASEEAAVAPSQARLPVFNKYITCITEYKMFRMTLLPQLSGQDFIFRKISVFLHKNV